MRRTIALWLIFVFLYNAVGYYGIYIVTLHQIQSRVDRRLDNESFSEAETITFKLPLISRPLKTHFQEKLIFEDF